MLALGLSAAGGVCKWAGQPWPESNRLNRREPIFNVPAVVVWLLAIFFAVHFALWLLPLPSSVWWIAALAFSPARYSAVGFQLPGGEAASITSLVTHMFVHGDLTHLLINSAWLLAFGTPIARRIDTVRFIVFFVLAGVAGALFYFAVNGPVRTFVVGASGAISGLMGAAFRFLFQELRRAEATGPDGIGPHLPLMPLAATIRDRRIFLAIVAWTVVNLALAWAAPVLLTDGAGIAWEAHLGGFYMGLLSFGFFDRQPSFDDNGQDDAAGASQ
jgi:membrane associated rhomboid family serine protease